MILPYQYRDFTIAGFYDEPDATGKCTFSVYIESQPLELCQCVGTGFESWSTAQAYVETAIDELIASWN